jgi:hypothetical protein
MNRIFTNLIEPKKYSCAERGLNCCNCGGEGCGCSYCWTCQACEACLHDTGEFCEYSTGAE